jgi:hypothetical protein
MPKQQQAERALKVDGSYEAFAIKLNAFLTGPEIERKHKRKVRAVCFVLAGLGVVGGFILFGRSDLELMGVGLFIAGMICIALGMFFGPDAHDEAAEGRRVEAALKRLKPDLHPRTPIKGLLDFGEATQREAEHTARSPYSGKLKKYFRHTWLSLRWGFTDGNVIALSVTDLVKTKSGGEIRREHQVRGRLSLNPAVYAWAHGDRVLTTGTLKVLPVQEDGKTHLLFWGTLSSLDALYPTLESVYATFRPESRGDRQALA